MVPTVTSSSSLLYLVLVFLLDQVTGFFGGRLAGGCVGLARHVTQRVGAVATQPRLSNVVVVIRPIGSSTWTTSLSASYVVVMIPFMGPVTTVGRLSSAS